MVTLTGVLICTISFLFAAYFAIKRLTGLEDASIGFTTLTCAVLGLGGFQLIAIGILGEYVGRIYEEVKRRPTHIVSDRSARRVTHENEHQRRAG